jgi:hypothetical protein
VDEVVDSLSSETKESRAKIFSMDEFEKWHQSTQPKDEDHFMKCLTDYQLLLEKVFYLKNNHLTFY